MKTILIFALFVSFIFQTHAQSTFALMMEANTKTISWMAIDDGEGGIITPVSELTGIDYGPSDYIHGYVLRISSTGDTTIHKYSFHDTTFLLNRIHRLNGGGYILAGQSRLPDTRESHFLLVGLDDDFSLQWAKHYAYDDFNDGVLTLDIFQVGDTLIFTMGRCEFPCTSYYPQFVKTDLNGNIIQQVFLDNPDLNSDSPTYMYERRNGHLWMFAPEFVGGVVGTSRSVFSKDFEYLFLKKVPTRSSSYRFTNVWTADSMILMSCISQRIGAQYQDDEIWIDKYDTALNLLGRISFGSVDTMDQTPLSGAGISYFHPDTIFFAGFKNSTGFNPSVSQVSWIMAGQVDGQLQPRFLHYLGGDAYYETRYMIALSDGGFLIQAGKFNHATKLYDQLYLKLNKEGLITGNKPAHTIINRAFISPNPAKETLKVECMLNGVEARILTLTGIELSKFNLEQGTTLLPLHDLSSGMYLLSIVLPGKGVIETHKFIKL